MRATPARIAELREELAEREGRLQAQIDQLRKQLDQRDEFGRRLAHNIGVAVTAALRDNPTRRQEGEPQT